jgi:phenylpropionate dioxygenase-like ring-hydroxylating dioxygenase large terminal subunit
MFSNISPYHYHNQEVFEKEKSQIFHNNWIFVAFGNDLLNHNDFVTKTIGGIPIVIQNFNGNIKAFMNVCSHRFSTIQNEEKGNRALFCPYHGWSFDKEGMPNGIPKKPLFKDFSKKNTIWTFVVICTLYTLTNQQTHLKSILEVSIMN